MSIYLSIYLYICVCVYVCVCIYIYVYVIYSKNCHLFVIDVGLKVGKNGITDFYRSSHVERQPSLLQIRT